MGTELANILTNVLVDFRWIGILIITIGAMAVLISEAIRSRLSPGRVFAVAGSAIVAAVLFWVLPSLIGAASRDSGTVVNTGCVTATCSSYK